MSQRSGRGDEPPGQRKQQRKDRVGHRDPFRQSQARPDLSAVRVPQCECRDEQRDARPKSAIRRSQRSIPAANIDHTSRPARQANG